MSESPEMALSPMGVMCRASGTQTSSGSRLKAWLTSIYRDAESTMTRYESPSNGRGAAGSPQGQMSHAIFGNVRLKRAGTTSIPLPKVSLNLGGESPGPIT